MTIPTTHTPPTTRRDPRHELEPGVAFLEIPGPDANAPRRAPVVSVSTSGFGFTLGDATGLDVGLTIGMPRHLLGDVLAEARGVGEVEIELQYVT